MTEWVVRHSLAQMLWFPRGAGLPTRQVESPIWVVSDGVEGEYYVAGTPSRPYRVGPFTTLDGAKVALLLMLAGPV